MSRQTSGDGAVRSASRYRELFEHHHDAIVEFELSAGEPIVREVNPAFETVFGYDGEDVVGESLNDLIVPAGRTDESTRLDARTASGETSYAVVERHTASGTRTFVYRGIPCDGGERGFAVYTDVTEELRTEQRVALLERVLRHDLRTEVTVIQGHAERVAERTDDERLVDSASAIQGAAGRLSRLAEQARELEETIEAADCTPTSPASLVADALDAAAVERRAARTAVDVPVRPRVLDGGSLTAALEALLDNAVRHNDGEPWVAVRASVEREAVELRVADDGPGLPDRERAVLEGECDESPLDHGSGLGLWIVHFAVRAAGGRIEVRDRDPRGTVVALRLRRADR